MCIRDSHMVERPVLIALHGGPGFDHSPMRPYFDRFADTHQVLYLDLRGNGRSSGAPETWTLKRWGQDIKQVCDFLGIERPVAVSYTHLSRVCQPPRAEQYRFQW